MNKTLFSPSLASLILLSDWLCSPFEQYQRSGSAHPPSLCPQIWAAQTQSPKHFTPPYYPSFQLYVSMCRSCGYNLVQTRIPSTNSLDPHIPSIFVTLIPVYPFVFLNGLWSARTLFSSTVSFFSFFFLLSFLLFSPSFCLFNRVADCPGMCGPNRKAVTRTQFWISTSFSLGFSLFHTYVQLHLRTPTHSGSHSIASHLQAESLGKKTQEDNII